MTDARSIALTLASAIPDASLVDVLEAVTGVLAALIIHATQGDDAAQEQLLDVCLSDVHAKVMDSGPTLH